MVNNSAYNDIKKKALRYYRIALYRIVADGIIFSLYWVASRVSDFRTDRWPHILILLSVNFEILILTIISILVVIFLFFLDLLSWRPVTYHILPVIIKLHFFGKKGVTDDYKIRINWNSVIPEILFKVLTFLSGLFIVYLVFGGNLGWFRLVLTAMTLGYLNMGFLYCMYERVVNHKKYNVIRGVYMYLINTVQIKRVRFLTGIRVVVNMHIGQFFKG